LDRYAEYARRSGVDNDVVTKAKGSVRTSESMVPARRNEQLLGEAGFEGVEVFYVGMAWRGWVAYV
jgi:tRNA (cmo5U34)-methyltransferase